MNESETFPTRPDAAAVYVYCSEQMGFQSNIAIDGEPYGQLGTQTYLRVELAPGRHTITGELDNTDTLEIDVQAGDAYFVWQELELGWVLPGVKLERVDERKGKQDIRRWARPVSPTYTAIDQWDVKKRYIAAQLLANFLGKLLIPAPVATMPFAP